VLAKRYSIVKTHNVWLYSIKIKNVSTVKYQKLSSNGTMFQVKRNRDIFRNGSAQAMLTVCSKGELEDAMKHPEKYQNLIVRVGGFSERS